MEKVGRNLKEKWRRKRAHRIYAEERVARSARARGGNRNERRKMGEKEGIGSGKKREVRRRRAVGNTSSGCYW